jgi:hypothetical protein
VMLVAVILGLSTGSSGEVFYSNAIERLGGFDVSTIGGREEVWTVAAEAFIFDNHWMYGSGTGGAERYLGRWPSKAKDIGIDGLERLYPHNTAVWVALAFGVPGLIICTVLLWTMLRQAYRLDSLERAWGRCAFLAILALIGCSCAIVMEPYFIAVGAILWAMLFGGHAIGSTVLSTRQRRVREFDTVVIRGASTSISQPYPTL